MIKTWFKNRLEIIMKHNDYESHWLTEKICNKVEKWTPCDLILREYYNNGGGSSQGFLGISKNECIKCYDYIKENLNELLELNMISKDGWNNSGYSLWSDYKIY